MTGLLVASNRGPVSFGRAPDGTLQARRGGGGLVSALSGLPLGDEVGWWCAALSATDREVAAVAAGRDLGTLPDAVPGVAGVRLLDIDPQLLERAYNRVANETLWFISHLLYELPLTPSFDAGFTADWEAFRSYNATFATALAAAADVGARVLVQDYHLALVPGLLRAARPDLSIAHFHHTPWAPPEYLRVLPDWVLAELHAGLLGADHLGFLDQRWAAAFRRGAVAAGAATADGDALTVADGSRSRRVSVGVHPLGVDATGLRERAGAPDVAQRRAEVVASASGLRLIVRVDRTEPSKNILRGIHSYAELLRRHPHWRGRVTHLVFAYPSRSELASYRRYTGEVHAAAAAVNAEFARPGWTPLTLQVADDYPRSLAALSVADVVVVNPVRDGMNLVAKEAAVLSERGVALVLSREAGAASELGDAALLINPFDIVATADAMNDALGFGDAERTERGAALAAAASAWPPARWLADLLAALTPRVEG